MKRHATDVAALTFGCVFLALVAVWALAKTVTVTLPSGGWFVASGLVFIGLITLAAALRPHKA
jgi:hypothetical protein